MRRRFSILIITISLVLSLPLPAAAASPNYFTTGHYKVYYDVWENVARAMDNGKYFDAAYNSAASVMGTGVDGLISVYFYSDPESRTDGSFWYDGSLSYDGSYITLNMLFSGASSNTDLAYYANTLAHETTHAIFYHVARDENDDAVWLDGGLAFYVGDYVYPTTQAYTSNYLGWQLKNNSQDGANKLSWYDTGINYLCGKATYLTKYQLPALGSYLYNLGGPTGISTLLNNIGKGMGLEAALAAAYGKPSGMYGTDTEGDTLYADYFRFYYGSS